MGDIYLARDRELARNVAVKVLAERFASDPNLRDRFKREALAAARLSHSHIVTIFDVGEWNGRPFIVMEYLAGGTLTDRTRGAPVEPARALGWLEQAAEALDCAHAEGIVHRDVKPANLLFDRRGDLHVVDFGIARILDDTGGLTATGTVLGTAGYISPEQARGEEATSASDVYGLGVVAYELLAGSRPFARGSATAEAAAHTHEPVPSASARRAALPRGIDDVFERALAKDPGARHGSAGELAQDLRAALEEGELETRAMPVPAPVRPAPPPRRARRRRPVLLAALAVLLLAAGGAIAAALTAASGDGNEARTVVATRVVTAQGKTVVRRQTVTVPVEAEPSPAPPPPPPPAPEPEPTQPAPPPPASPPPAVAGGHDLNEQGFALMQEGNYEAAEPVLRQAVESLRGTYTSSDRAEAYANYNLGYTLLRLGRCEEALPYLNRSERLQGHREEIDAAQAEAQACLANGGQGTG